MSQNFPPETPVSNIDAGRRKLLVAAGATALASRFGSLAFAADVPVLRWGVVGTGGIAGRMAPRFHEAPHATLAAVSSRHMATAREFADAHEVEHAFDSWQTMFEGDFIDAVYIATPTAVKEEIALAAIRAGKHVLVEKPFANLPSVQRITAACRAAGVAFMDGTHFVHDPRTFELRRRMADDVGRRVSVDSALQFLLKDESNIRFRPDLEPYGAIGDTGWYNIRAAVEFTAPGSKLLDAETFMRRDAKSGAAVSGSGLLRFDDGSTSTWNCGFETGASIQDLRLAGDKGVIRLLDFVFGAGGKPNSYEVLSGWNDSRKVEVAGGLPAATLMFEDFAAMLGDVEAMEASMRSSERTQEWLDAAWGSALENDRSG